MAENLLNTKHRPWFPQGTGGVDFENNTYVYSPTLKKTKPKLYERATNMMSYSIRRTSEQILPSLDELLRLAKDEQKKEDLFLSKKFGVQNSDARSDGQRIKEFNALYQKKEIFERNVKKIEEANERAKSSKIDITSVFKYYLQTEIKKLRINQMNEVRLKEAVERAIIAAFTSQHNEKEAEAQRSYESFLGELQKMANYNQFIDDVFDIYLGSTWRDYQKALKTQGKQKEKVKVVGSRGLSGNLLELVTQKILETLGEKSRMTGAGGQKADLVIADYELDIPEELVYGLQSVRADFIRQWKDFYSKQLQTTDIVEISAKNYTLGNDFSGFTAQDKVTIDNFAATLKEYGFSSDRLDPLVFALLNIGPDTLQQDDTIVKRNLCTLIAYFLFDDIDMDLNGPVNAIHLFNLDGIYVPLSSFLFAAYDSLRDFETASKKYVSVSYSPKAVLSAERYVDLNEEHWETALQEKLDQTSIKIHFFKNFTDYIKSLNLLN